MNNDEKFHQRWEFRRKEVDGDTSSDDNQSNASGAPAVKRPNLVTDLVLLENDEASENPECQRHDKRTLEADKKKIKSSKKKKVNGCSVKKKKRKMNLKNEEMVMLNDLKVFADSLIQELTVSRENMFAHMKEEMRKLVACRSKPIKKNVRCSQKNKLSRQKSIRSLDRNVKSNVGSNACKFPKASAEAVNKNDRVLEVTTKNELLTKGGDGLRVSTTAHMNLANGSDQVASSSYLTLPTVIPKPLFQNPRNHLPLSDHIHIPPGVPMNNSNSETRDTGKLIDDKRLYQRFAEFRPKERFGSFFHVSHKSVGLLGQNCSQASSVAFPVPLKQGTDNGSTISSLSYCENSFVDNNNKVSPRMNGIVRMNPALADQIFTRKSDGEFVPVRPQELKDGHFYLTSLRNQQ